MRSQIGPLVVQARIHQLGQALASMREYAARVGLMAGLVPRAVYNLKLALDEIATNIITHGYGTGGADETIALMATITSDRLVVTMEDSAPRYNPTEHVVPIDPDSPLETREIGGLGLYLAITHVDHYQYEYVDGCNRSTFVMLRPRAGYSAPSPSALICSHTHHIEHMLTVSGFIVQTRGAREDIAQLVTEGGLDMVILASDVSRADGFWILKRIAQTQRDIPVLVVSGDTNYIAHCLELGARDFMREPLDRRLLSARIETMLRAAPAFQQGSIQKLSHHIKNILLSDEPALRFGRDLDFDRYLERFLSEVQAIYRADAGTLYLRTDTDALRFAIVNTISLGLELGGTSGKEVDFPMVALFQSRTGLPNHHNVASHVALTGETVNISDIYENEEFDFSGTRWFDTRNGYRSVSTLTVPLKDHTDDVIGVVQLINAQSEGGAIVPFDTAHQMIVEALCAYTAVVISNHRLLRHQEKLIQLESDLKLGRQIQRDFMPHTIPVMPGWQIAARFHPAHDVAGDFYDVFESQGNLILIVADVCDKGVAAALFMALIRSLLRAFISQARARILALSPGERTVDVLATNLKQVVANTNDYILEHHYDLSMFATVFIGVLLSDSGRLLYINAGHTPVPLVFPHGGAESIQLKPNGPAVGMFDDARFEAGEVRLQHGDLLLALTDGYTDSRNASGETLGYNALMEIIAAGEWANVDDLLARLEDRSFNHMGDQPQFDDMTCIAAYRTAK